MKSNSSCKPTSSAMRRQLRSFSLHNPKNEYDDTLDMRIDALGVAAALRSEALTAISLLMVATCAFGFML